MNVAIVTGASRGLGLALARELAHRGFALVVDARGDTALREAERELSRVTTCRALAGDVSDEAHREALVAAATALGDLKVLVNNASVLGPSPQPELASYPLEEMERVYRVNVLAPLALVQLALPHLEPGGRIINITSDAATAAYPGWGGYGSSKAALEQLSNVLAAEQPEVRVYWVDPGDMNTQMQKEAFPDEDVSDRPAPGTSVPGLLLLIEDDFPSGRYEARTLAAEKVTT